MKIVAEHFGFKAEHVAAVANGAGLIIEIASILHTEAFRHGDLNAVDVDAVPDRLEHRIRKSRIKYVLYWLLAEVVSCHQNLKTLGLTLHLNIVIQSPKLLFNFLAMFRPF
jgi:hypothetical protein